MSRRRKRGKSRAEFGRLLRAMAVSADDGQNEAARAALTYTSRAERGESDRTQFISASEALARILGATKAQLSAVSVMAESDDINDRVAISVRAAVAELRWAARLLTLGAVEFERVAKAIEPRPEDID